MAHFNISFRGGENIREFWIMGQVELQPGSGCIRILFGLRAYEYFGEREIEDSSQKIRSGATLSD